jgi:hypothetical protein
MIMKDQINYGIRLQGIATHMLVISQRLSSEAQKHLNGGAARYPAMHDTVIDEETLQSVEVNISQIYENLEKILNSGQPGQQPWSGNSGQPFPQQMSGRPGYSTGSPFWRPNHSTGEYVKGPTQESNFVSVLQRELDSILEPGVNPTYEGITYKIEPAGIPMATAHFLLERVPVPSKDDLLPHVEVQRSILKELEDPSLNIDEVPIRIVNWGSLTHYTRGRWSLPQ